MRRIQTIAGCLALLGALVLASPGVRIARANPPVTGAPTAGEQCSSREPGRLDEVVGEFLEELRREHAGQGSEQTNGVVMLNNRGYNYGPPPGIQLDVLRAEASSRR